MNNHRFAVSKQILRLLAALTWYIGACILLLKGGSLLHEASELRPEGRLPLFAALVGVFVGLLKGVYIFNTSCHKNLKRIAGLAEPRLWQFFRPQFFIFLTLMVTAGATSSRLAHGNFPMLIGVGIVDLSVGVALLVSSQVFWKVK